MNELINKTNHQRYTVMAMDDKHDFVQSGTFYKPTLASRRLLCSAALLPEGEHLAFQMDAARLAAVTYASDGASIAAEDLEWIFSPCATVVSGADDGDDGFAKNPHLYAFSLEVGQEAHEDSSRGDFHFLDESYEESCESLLDDLFCMMESAGAVIRIMVYGAAKTTGLNGQVLLSLPDRITLRMRSLLSIVFPKTRLAEVTDGGACAGEDASLSEAGLLDFTKKLIFMLLYQSSKKAEQSNKGNEQEGKAREDDGHTDLEVLDLPVRAYNCLKRAGIDSVEKLRGYTLQELMRIRNMGRKCAEAVVSKMAEYDEEQQPEPSEPKSKPDYRAMLDKLIGLDNVKAQIKRVAAFARMQQDLKETGGDLPDMSLHMAFVGNPGTAKTTVARLLAGIFSDIGLLKSDEIVEVGRADLVGEYVGQTSKIVREVFRRAKGKLLFIDEAYSLVDHHRGSFGDEAINTIIQEMENARNDTVVILAGYPTEMMNLFDLNAGFRSRVPFTVAFDDYTAEEMAQIVELEAGKRGFTIESEAAGRIRELCAGAVGDTHAGNGRFCRNLIERAVLAYSERVYASEDAVGRDRILIVDDFSAPDGIHQAPKPPMGFSA